jgi:hypothetical protein
MQSLSRKYVSKIFIAQTYPYLNNYILPFKVDVLKIKYLFNKNPIIKVIIVSIASAADGAVIKLGRKIILVLISFCCNIQL